MRWSPFDWSVRVAALLVAATLCCDHREPVLQAPSVLAESTETVAPENAELIKRCLPFAKSVADSMHIALGPPHFTHSDKWGDILRVDFTGKDEWATRMVCSNNMNIVVGVIPSGIEELVPSKMQGVWAEEGKCRARSERLVITSTAAQFGTRQPYEIRYFLNRDTDHGEFWTIDATWLAPQYDSAKDAMVWTDKSGTTTYLRCPNRD